MLKNIKKFIKEKFNKEVTEQDKVTSKGNKYKGIYFIEESHKTNCNIMIFSDTFAIVQYKTYKKGLPLGESITCKTWQDVKKVLSKLLP